MEGYTRSNISLLKTELADRHDWRNNFAELVELWRACGDSSFATSGVLRVLECSAWQCKRQIPNDGRRQPAMGLVRRDPKGGLWMKQMISPVIYSNGLAIKGVSPIPPYSWRICAESRPSNVCFGGSEYYIIF